MSRVTVSRRIAYGRVVIELAGAPHLIFDPAKFVALQTWKSADRYSLELHLLGAVVTTEYDSLEKLSGVAKCIEEALE
jgi:hypothetical protein